jgi:hypothetical protein
MSQKKVLLVGECVLDIIQEVQKYPGEDDDIRYDSNILQMTFERSNKLS